MKATYKTANGRLTLEMEYSDDRDLFEKVAHVDEVFGDLTCGAKVDGGKWVESDDVKFVVREVDGNKYYEVWPRDSRLRGFKKSYGCHKKGNGLFPKRMDKETHTLASNGYAKFKGGSNSENQDSN